MLLGQYPTGEYNCTLFQQQHITNLLCLENALICMQWAQIIVLMGYIFGDVILQEQRSASLYLWECKCSTSAVIGKRSIRFGFERFRSAWRTDWQGCCSQTFLQPGRDSCSHGMWTNHFHICHTHSQLETYWLWCFCHFDSLSLSLSLPS